MQTFLLVLSLIGAMVAVQSVFLLAHHVQQQVGTMALGAVAGASMFGLWLFANSVPVLFVSNTFSFPLLSLIVYANLLAFLLVVYACDGTRYTQRLLLVLLAVCTLTIVFQELAALAHGIDAIRNRFSLAELLFHRNWRATTAAVIALVLSFLMVISGFQLLTNYFPKLPRSVRVGLVLVVVLLTDGLLYTTLAFAGQPFYADAMRNQVVSKFMAAVVLTPGAAWYIGRSLRLQAAQQAEFRPVFDVVGGVTEMDREMETILETMVDGMILFSTEGRITRANSAAVRLFGQPLTGLRLDDPLLRLVYPDGSRIPYGDSPMLQVLRTHRAHENVELGIRQNDGSLRILSINASPLLDSRHRMRGGLATFRDVTQRKQIDESLAASQEFLRSLIEEAPIGIIVFDQEGVAEHINKFFLRAMGLESANDLIGRMNVFTEPVYVNTDLIRHFVQAYKGKVVEIPPIAIDVQRRQAVDLTEVFAAANGANTDANVKVVSHLLFPVRDRRNKVRSVVALVTDLTERTHAEKGRQEIEARFQDMVARISDYLFSARVEHGSLKYEFCTPVIERVTGYPPDFFLNDNWFWFKIILVEDQQRVQDELLNLFTQREEEGVVEYRIRTRRGETRWLQSRFTILRNDKGKVERVIGAVSDLSRQKEAEEAVRRAVGKFRSLVETMHELVLTIDAQGKITFANRTFYRTMQYSERSVLGRKIADYLPPEQVETFKETFLSLMRAERSLRNYELRFRQSNGEYLLLMMNADPLYEESGSVNGVLLVAFDITERRRAVEAIQKRNAELVFMTQLGEQFKNTVGQEELFQLVHEFLPAAMGIQHTDIALWHDHLQMLVSENGVAGDLATPQLGHQVSQRCFETGQPVIINDCSTSELVDPQWLQIAGVQSTAAVPILAAGRAIGVLRVDDTHNKNRFTEENLRYLRVVAQQLSAAIQNTRLYQKLRSSEENYRSLFESAAVGIYRATIDGHLLAANPALVKMLSYQTAADVLALNMPEHLFCRREDFETLMSLLRQRKFVSAFETEFKRRDGSRIEVRINVRQVSDAQQVVEQVEGDVSDITEEKALREQLLQAQKLEGLGRLAGGLAHDFNNYLNAIINNLTLVREHLSASEGTAAKYLRDAELAADQGADLVHKLLAFSRSYTEAGDYLDHLPSPAEVPVVDLNACINEVISLLRPSLARGVQLEFEPAAEPVTVAAESLQLKQVIMNLSVNAHDALLLDGEISAGRGRIAIRTARVDIDEAYCQKNPQAHAGTFVRLTVADTGAGIDEKVQQRMFEPFFTTKAPGKGTGLGLAVVYGLVQKLGGWITYSTKLGEGTTFEVYLPWTPLAT